MPNTIFFDLDGTLTDPAEGITRSIQYACHQLGIPIPSQEELLSYIGPPIQSTFAALLKTDDQEAITVAVQLYRERYSTQGMLFENAVYPGVEDMLHHLNRCGKRLFVATSKPTVYAVPILQHFDLDKYFVRVYGSDLDGTRTNKAALLAHILEKEQLSARDVAMIGDRKHDIIGARHNGVYAVGVTYGYGSAEELNEAGADVLCHTPAEIAVLFCNV